MEQWRLKKRFEFVIQMLNALYGSQDVTNIKEDSLYLEYELEEKKLMKLINK